MVNPCRQCGQTFAELYGNMRQFCSACQILRKNQIAREYYLKHPRKAVIKERICALCQRPYFRKGYAKYCHFCSLIANYKAMIKSYENKIRETEAIRDNEL